MTTQNYLIVEKNVVTNNVVWDGDVNTWTPPADSIQLIQATTPAMIWEENADKTDYVLTEQMGAGDIGFIWDGSACVTNQPKPTPQALVEGQPVTTGTQTI